MTSGEEGFLLLSCHFGNPDRKILTTAQLRTLAARVTGRDWTVRPGDLTCQDIAALGYDTGFSQRIVGLLGERVDYAVSAFLATNFGMAVLFPFLIPIAIGNPAPTVFADVIGSLCIVVGIPVALAVPLRKLYPGATELPKRCKNLSFFTWVAAIFLIIANASQFLREQQANLPPGILWKIAVVSLLICIVNFAGGRMIGGKKFFRESSQVLGQKNTTLTIFLAITYANPLIALGPTFYVIWHNGWNAWQLQMRTFRERKKRRRVTLLRQHPENI